jgi:N-acetyl-D-muramate 6-phosphate phosphatase
MYTFRNISTILFDLDGTLIDSAPDLAAAADEMRVSRGMASLPLDIYRPMAGAGARGMLGIAFGLTPDAPDYEVLREEFFSNYERCMTQQTYAFDGVLALIDEICQSQFRWGVVTNKSRRFTEPLTQGMPLFSTASVVISGDTTPHAKPHPEPLFEAARRLGVDPAQCVYVGDDQRDIVAGLAAGMLTVAATYGYLGTKSDVNTWGAHAQINSPLDLLQLLVST